MSLSIVSDWREIQRKNFNNVAKLLEYLQLDPQGVMARPSFPVNLPLRLARKIPKGMPDDPLLRQFLPLDKETVSTPGFVQDPVGDSACRKSSKLLHKYKGRVLLVTTSACAMHCRYCFRQNFDYASDIKDFDAELAAIAADASINEVILSGGDPLSLSNERLAALITHLEKIPHLTKLRFHTRFPIGIPERIDAGFLMLLEQTRLQVWFVIHCNHPRELDEDIFAALRKVQRLGIPVLNQTVLLKGVNDDEETLYALFLALADRGVVPYYLHQLDPVAGSAHFEVKESAGKALIEGLRARLPGYAVPRYVREIPLMASKTPIV